MICLHKSSSRLHGGFSVFISNVALGTTCVEKGVVLDVFTPYREDFVGQSNIKPRKREFSLPGFTRFQGF